MEVKAYSLMDGIFSVDRSKQFLPFDPDRDDPSTLPHGSNILGVSPFLVVTDNDLVLLDSGLGIRNERGERRLLQHLADLGYNPTDITMVILSHLHKDHIKGLGDLKPDGTMDFLFPAARLYYQQKEMEYALHTDTPSFDKALLTAITRLPNGTTLDGDGSLTDEISYFITGGILLITRL